MSDAQQARGRSTGRGSPLQEEAVSRFEQAWRDGLRPALEDYLPDDDLPLIHRFFPQARISTLAGAGHWLHAEQPGPFLQTVTEFLLHRPHPS